MGMQGCGIKDTGMAMELLQYSVGVFGLTVNERAAF